MYQKGRVELRDGRRLGIACMEPSGIGILHRFFKVYNIHLARLFPSATTYGRLIPVISTTTSDPIKLVHQILQARAATSPTD